MGIAPKVALRSLTEAEQKSLQTIVKATSERADVVKRAQALLAVSVGCTFTEAGKQAGISRQAATQLVERFNQRGLAVLLLAAGRGRKATYTSTDRERILQEVRRAPDREKDQTGSWSLSTLQQALRKNGLPHISRDTIAQVLHEAGYTYQRTRTWCPTGTALRVHKAGVVTVHDPETEEKKD
ncbi:MAG: helix-turn-helix domain-containing protein [Ktedonobacteraceae bacterium]